MTGGTPISHSTTVNGSVSKEIEFMAGRFKKNPDGTVNRNERPFRDTGELNKFMAGQNDLGNPIVKDDGKVLRRADGSVVHQGAKLFKYGANATPSRDGTRRRAPSVPDAWTSFENVKGGVNSQSFVSKAPVYRSPERKAK